jgi:alpha-ribazole phosphatase
MRLILIRHPETQANVKGLIYGRSESDYSEKGRASIDWVVDHLQGRTIHTIYASPLSRTADLAAAIGNNQEVPVLFHDDLLEMNFGLFENMTPEEAADRYRSYFNAYMNDYAGYAIPEGESFKEVYDRVAGFLKSLPDGQVTCVIVTHGMVIKAALAYLLDISLEEVWHISTKPAAIIEIEYTERYGVLHGLTGPEIG